ncbi:TIGR03087 family PEP-CTERM/XrtA system glycosyltransferase [Colwelliaceae bacterium 6471]
MNKEPLLFLCHRIPFPPNKGDKIRSFNILKKLSEQFDVHLGCFIDDPYDEQFSGSLEDYCRSVFCLNQNKTIAKVKGLKAFLTGQAITLPYYFDRNMQQWVQQTVASYDIKKVFIYSSSMAQYCESAEYESMNKVIDFVDVDSDKWRQYAENKSGIARWVYNREYQKLASYEDKICHAFNHSVFVSPDEAALFAKRQPISEQAKVHGILNGVDIEFFNPVANFEQESMIPNGSFISFTGAMDYWANVEAVVWFAENVWPKIHQAYPELLFYIVGGNPSTEVESLAQHSGIVVTGRVHDIRPFIAKASCSVAPIRIARGIQNKVLEAMALAKTVVLTPMAAEGISFPEQQKKLIIDDSDEFAQAVISVLEHPDSAQSIGHENRIWMEEHYQWKSVLEPLLSLLKE